MKTLRTAFFVSLLFISFVNVNNCSAQCHDSLWSHVYHSYRLYVMDSCATATGTVWSVIYEADGDCHIRLTVDSPYVSWLNAANYSGEYGKLVCEPICDTTVTQADAVAPCSGFTNTVFIPANGEHVAITGAYVTDNDHGWNELHPVSKIVIQPLSTPSAVAPYNKPQVTVYPNPAKSHINFKLSETASSPVFITIADEMGRLAGQYQMQQILNLQIDTKLLSAGKYYYHISKDNVYLTSGTFILNK